MSTLVTTRNITNCRFGSLHSGSHDGLVHSTAVTHGTLDHSFVLLSGVFLAGWEPTLEFVFTFITSKLVFDHNIIYIIQLTYKVVYYIILKCYDQTVDMKRADPRKLLRARTRAVSR